MEYKNIDFNADKVKHYEAVREAMARIYIFSFYASTSFWLKDMKPKTDFVSVPSSCWLLPPQKVEN